MKAKIELEGLYKVFNGKTCDNYGYYALLVAYYDCAFITPEWIVEGGSDFTRMELVKLKEGEDLFEKFGIIGYEKVK